MVKDRSFRNAGAAYSLPGMGFLVFLPVADGLSFFVPNKCSVVHIIAPFRSVSITQISAGNTVALAGDLYRDARTRRAGSTNPARNGRQPAGMKFRTLSK